jgi:hypothetical protein
LHDVVEDSDMDFADLLNAGIAEDIAQDQARLEKYKAALGILWSK